MSIPIFRTLVRTVLLTVLCCGTAASSLAQEQPAPANPEPKVDLATGASQFDIKLIQKHFAAPQSPGSVLAKPLQEAKEDEATRQETYEVFRQTRIDRVYLNREEGTDKLILSIEGVCISQRQVDPKVLSDAIVEVLKKEYAAYWTNITNQGEAIEPSNQIKFMDQKSVPWILLQDQLEKKRQDGSPLEGALVYRCLFNADGELECYGFVPDEAGRAEVVKLLTELAKPISESADPPLLWLTPSPHRAGKPAWSSSQKGLKTWNPRQQLQAKLSSEGQTNPALRGTLIRHAYFDFETVANAAPKLVLNLEGVSLTRKSGQAGGTSLPKEDEGTPEVGKTNGELTTLLKAEAAQHWKGIWKDYFHVTTGASSDTELANILAALDANPESVIEEYDTEQIKLYTTPVYELQRKAAEKPEWDLIFFSAAEYDAQGRLIIKGSKLDGLNDAEIKTFVTENTPNQEDILSKRLPAEDTFGLAMKNYASAPSRKELQRRFGLRDERPLRQLRLDHLAFIYGNPNAEGEVAQELVPFFHPVGVCLTPTWAREGAVPAAPEMETTCAKALRDPRGTVQDFFREQLAEPYTVIFGNAVRSDLSLIEAVPDPVVALQEGLTAEPKWDGLLFLGSGYEEDGALELSLVVAEKMPAEAVTEASKLVAELAEDVRYEKCFRAGSGTPWKVAPLTGGPFLKAALQSRLASDEDENAQRLRVDRAYLDYFQDDPTRVSVVVDGVSLDPEFELKQTNFRQNNDDAAFQAISTAIRAELKKEWPALANDRWCVSLISDLSPVKAFAPFGEELQAEVAKEEKLDGVRLYTMGDPNLYAAKFDREGKLVLLGYWLGTSQQEPLTELVTKFFTQRDAPMTAQALDLSSLTPFPLDQVLLRLREYTAKTLSDVWVKRLYFNKDGKLEIVGFYSEEADGDAIKTELVRLLDEAAHHREETAALEFVNLLQNPFPEIESGQLTRAVPSLTQRLRTLVQAPTEMNRPNPPIPWESLLPSPSWDGIWIQRGSYSPTGVYRPVGFYGNEAQAESLSALLVEKAVEEEWKDRLPGEWDLSEMEVKPILPVLEGFQTVMPAYPVCDGLNLLRIFHDTDGKMILYVGHYQPIAEEIEAKVETLIRRLLDEKSVWKVRIQDGVELRPEDLSASLSVYQAERMVDAAIIALTECEPQRAAKLLSTALYRVPEDSSAWYVRSLCYLMHGDYLRAHRDMRRVLGVEYSQYPTSRGQVAIRVRNLERIQGQWRRAADWVLEREEVAAATGKPPLRLTDVP